MFQQLLAVVIIIFLVSRIYWQFKNGKVAKAEFRFWLGFWFLVLLAIVFLKQIDQLVASFGFSSSGIQILVDLSVVLLLYFIFRLRLRLAKIEKDITRIVESLAINKK